MELIGVYVITSPVFKNQVIVFDENYQINANHSAVLKEIKIEISRSSVAINYYQHVANTLMVRIIHGINGTGKTTLLRMLALDPRDKYILIFQNYEGYYFEGCLAQPYRFIVNGLRFDTIGLLTKQYFSLIYTKDELGFYTIGDRSRNTRFFVSNLLRERVQGGDYFIARQSVDMINNLEKAIYLLSNQDLFSKYINVQDYGVRLSLHVPSYFMKPSNELQFYIAPSEEEMGYFKATEDVFHVFGINIDSIRQSIINGFWAKIIADAIGISRGKLGWLKPREYFNILDFAFAALKHYFNEGEGIDVKRSEYMTIVNFLSTLNKKSYTAVDGKYIIKIDGNSPLILNLLEQNVEYKKTINNFSSSFLETIKDPSKNDRSKDSPYLSKVYEYAFDVLFQDLSDGEKAFLDVTLGLLVSLENDSIYATDNKGISYILIDEIEKHLHPELCRQLIQHIVSILKNATSRYCLIATSHSEYILSDIPVRNTISLDKNRPPTQKETFAKNIGDIAMDNMIVSNPIGEFAKETIKKLVENPDRERSLATIEMIGDPFIKKMLLSSLSRGNYD